MALKVNSSAHQLGQTKSDQLLPQSARVDKDNVNQNYSSVAVVDVCLVDIEIGTNLMEQAFKEVLQLASFLVSHLLTAEEDIWIKQLVFAVWKLLGTPDLVEEARIEVVENSKQALKILVRNKLFPINFPLLQFAQLHQLRTGIQSKLSDDYTGPLTPPTAETEFETQRFPLLARLSPYQGKTRWSALENQIGPCVFVVDAQGNAAPCVVLNNNSLEYNRPICSNQLVICTSWRYCPIPSSFNAPADSFRAIHGYFEILQFNNLGSPPSMPEPILKLQDAFDRHKGKFKKQCLPQQMPVLSLTGQVRRMSSIMDTTPSNSMLLLDLYSVEKDFSVAVLIRDTTEMAQVLGGAIFWKTGDFVVISHLTPSLLRVPDHDLIPCFETTSLSQMILVPSPLSEEEATKAAKKQKRREKQNEEATRLVASYSGVVSRVIHSHCFELNDRYLVVAHRQVYGLTTRKGAKIKLRFVHQLLDADGAVLGFGLCAHSRMELIDFAPSFDPEPTPLMPLADNSKLYPLPLCVFVETARKWLANHYDVGHSVGVEQILHFLLTPEAVASISGRFNLTSPSDPLHEWFGHDSRKYGGELGCQAMGRLDGPRYPTITTIDQLLLAVQQEPSLQLTKVQFWSYSVIDPMEYLEKNHKVLVGKLTDRVKLQSTPASNFLVFESENDGVQVPILVPGAHLRHLNIPCCLSSFIIIRECTVPRYGPRSVKPATNFPFDFYLLCELQHIRFAGDCIDDPVDSVQGAWVVNLIRKETPRYKEIEDASSIFYQLNVEVIESSAGLSYGTGGHFQRKKILVKHLNEKEQLLWPLLHPGSTYHITRLARPEENGRGWNKYQGGSKNGGDSRTDSTLELQAGFTVQELPVAQDPFQRFLVPGIAEERDFPQVEELATLRNGLHGWKSVKSLRTVTVRALIVSRHQESVLCHQDARRLPARYLPEETQEWRSNTGQIMLELRALDTPDSIVAFFNPHTTHLPLGLVPGMIGEFRYVQLKRDRKNLKMIFADYGSSFEVIGFDPDFLELVKNRRDPQIALPLRRDALERGFHHFDSGLKSSLKNVSSLAPWLVEGISWVDEHRIPYRHFADIPIGGLDKRIFRTRAILTKVYRLLFETRCISCKRVSRRGVCSFGCQESSMEKYAEMTANFSDSTGNAKISVQGSSRVFSLLSTSHVTRNLISAVVERMGALIIENNEVHIPRISSLTEAAEDVPAEEATPDTFAHTRQEEPTETDQAPYGQQSTQHTASLSNEEIASIRALVDKLAGKIQEPMILITSFFDSTREELTAIEGLPYILSKKRSGQKSKPPTLPADLPAYRTTIWPSLSTISSTRLPPLAAEETHVQVSNAVGSINYVQSEPSNSFTENRLSIRTPNLDVIWSCRASDHVKQECVQGLQKLKSLAPDLFR